MSKLQVTIRYATLTKNYDTFGKMQNYVKVKYSNGSGGTSDFKSKLVAGQKDKPITWNQNFSVPIKPNAQSFFEFTVLDQDLTSDDICGKALFKPDKCGVFNNGAQTYNLRLINGSKDEVSGSLHITTRFV